jgi:CheY-like chemotaxis protein
MSDLKVMVVDDVKVILQGAIHMIRSLGAKVSGAIGLRATAPPPVPGAGTRYTPATPRLHPGTAQVSCIATNGEEAEQKLKLHAKELDVLFTDIRMPKGFGDAVVAKYRRAGPLLCASSPPDETTLRRPAIPAAQVPTGGAQPPAKSAAAQDLRDDGRRLLLDREGARALRLRRHHDQARVSQGLPPRPRGGEKADESRRVPPAP